MSYVKISDTLYYGIHPQLVDPGKIFDHYVNLTEDHEFDSFKYEKPSSSSYRTYTNFPIKDRGAPTIELLTVIVNYVLSVSNKGESVYIFCKGGHGRSGTVMSAVYGKLHKLSGVEAMAHIDKEWRAQRDMSYLRPKIIELGSPQTRVQKSIVKKFLSS